MFFVCIMFLFSLKERQPTDKGNIKYRLLNNQRFFQGVAMAKSEPLNKSEILYAT